MARLPDGVTIHIGGKRFAGEIPDDLLPGGKTEPVAEKPKKAKPSESSGKS